MATYHGDEAPQAIRQPSKLEALHDQALDISAYARRVRENLVEVNDPVRDKPRRSGRGRIARTA